MHIILFNKASKKGHIVKEGDISLVIHRAVQHRLFLKSAFTGNDGFYFQLSGEKKAVFLPG